jgi:hypothetical protein
MAVATPATVCGPGHVIVALPPADLPVFLCPAAVLDRAADSLAADNSADRD